MENKNIIIILLVIIVVLAAGIGVMLLDQTTAKEPTKVRITSDKSQYEGGKVSVLLTDLNKTAISKEKINIAVIDKKGKVVVNKTVKTNSKGKAKLDCDLKKGKYTVNVTYGGNENYSANNTTQKLTINKKAVKAQPTVTKSDTYVERQEGNLKYGYKDGRYGFWTPSGNFIEDKSRAISGGDSVEPYTEDGSFYDQV